MPEVLRADMLRAWVDGEPAAGLRLDDRGLHYGDGVFETMRVAAAAIPLWDRHYARLAAGSARLSIVAPARELLAREIAGIVAGCADGVVKLIVTRGAGTRGYDPGRAAASTRIMMLYDAPAMDPATYRDGIAVRWCELALAINPRLAGIKHLNRLEQVLARAEWNDAAVSEGLVRDSEGRVIGATAANVFAVIAARIVTPALHRCGVEGVARALILDAPPGDTRPEVRDMLPAELEGATEVFLSNAIRGVVPVTRLGQRTWPVGPAARELMQRFSALGLPPHAHG